jgi:hypothetical protein
MLLSPQPPRHSRLETARTHTYAPERGPREGAPAGPACTCGHADLLVVSALAGSFRVRCAVRADGRRLNNRFFDELGVTRNIGQHTPKIVMLDAPFFQVGAFSAPNSGSTHSRLAQYLTADRCRC